MDKISKSLVSMVLGILILVGLYFGVYDQWQKSKDNQASLELSQQQNDKLKKAQADASSFLSKYQNNASQADVASRALPVGDADVPNLLQNFSSLIAASGLNLKLLNIMQETDAGKTAPAKNSIQSKDIEVQMTGTYEAFRDLLLRVQGNLRLTDLISINVNADTGESGGTPSSILNFSLKFRTYYQQ